MTVRFGSETVIVSQKSYSAGIGHKRSLVAIAPESRIIRAICRDGRRVNRHRPCSITCPTIACCSSMKAMSRSRRSVVCTEETVHARRPWWNMVSACRRRWITDPCASRNSNRCLHKPCSCRRPRAFTRTSTARRWTDHLLRQGAAYEAPRAGFGSPTS